MRFLGFTTIAVLMVLCSGAGLEARQAKPDMVLQSTGGGIDAWGAKKKCSWKVSYLGKAKIVEAKADTCEECAVKAEKKGCGDLCGFWSDCDEDECIAGDTMLLNYCHDN